MKITQTTTLDVNPTLINGLQLQHTVLKHPYSHFSQKWTNYLFPKIMALKTKGYQSGFSATIVPMEQTDFIATHHTLCRVDDTVTPIMTCKTLELNTCIKHKLQFPLLNIIDPKKFPRHYKMMQNTLDDAQRTNGRIFYGFGWTMDPSITDRALRETLKEIFITTHVSFYEQMEARKYFGLPMVANTYPFFSKYGERISRDSDGELPPLTMPQFYDAEAYLLEGTVPNPTISALKIKYKELLDKQIIEDQDMPRTERIVA